MTSTPDQSFRSPWLTLWLSPRLTIEGIVGTRPRHLVLLLAILGAMAGLYGELVAFGAEGLLADWRFWLGFVLICAIVGPVWLYISALILNWISRLLGGRAPPLALRAVIAWSAVPSILGFVVVLIAGAVAGDRLPQHNILAVLVGAFGLWSTVVFMLMLARVQHFGFWRTIATYVLNAVLVSFLLAVSIRTLLYQPFNVPAASMMPTLLVGDYFFVEKFTYGYSRFSLPFSPPLFSGRILASEPQRGDVVVFRAPNDVSTDFVKRVVGLPGDRIQMKDGRLYLNDMPVTRERIADYAGGAACGSATSRPVKRWRETLANGRSYETLDCVDNGFYDNTNLFTVPPGHVFVMGDNRDNSIDSRVLRQMGYVPYENLVGRVRMIFFSRAAGEGGAAPVVRTERIGMLVR
ncbi:MAG TPA: signal peptidase I [Bradyrhizobium sp.]|nr:signal peptidase I [Bradyrhizobium sp.]